MRVLDGALLDVEAATVETLLREDAVLVSEVDGRVVGVLVAAPAGVDVRPTDAPAPDRGARVVAVAVRRRRRRRGIGSALVAAATDRWEPLLATFDPDVRPFYASLDFEIRPVGDEPERLRGVRRTD